MRHLRASLRNASLGVRIIAMTVTLLVVVLVINYAVFLAGYRDAAEAAMVEKAAAFTAVADEAKNHTAAIASSGAFDMQELLAELEQTLAAGKPYTQAKVFKTIPVVAGWSAARQAAEREGITFRISAFDARNPENEPAPGTFSHTMLTDLRAQLREDPSDEVLSRVDPATNTLHYMRAIRLTDDCLMCHGQPGNQWDTDGDGKDPLGFEMEGWATGRMHGTYHVLMPQGPVDAQVAGFLTQGLAWTVPLVIGGVGAFVFLINAVFGRPVRALIARIKDIAQGEGDLTQRLAVSGNDELGQLGQWFNRFVGKIHDLVAEVSGVTGDVASAATQIAASSEQMATGMDEQRQQVERVSAAVEQMNASIVEVARKSTEAASSADESGRTATEGGRVVQETIDGMHQIRDAVSSSAEAVTELGHRGQQIGQVIDVITEIADQTNLLALNAAIEAARAGEHGRGFAVVADEVRKLADRTTQATDQTRATIQLIQQETDQAVGRMHTGTDQVAKGVTLAGQAGHSLEQIVGGAQNVAGMIQSIAAAAEQQSAASEEVGRNVQGIAAMAQQANQGASQAAEAAALLSQRAERLRHLVGVFKVDPTATNG